MPPSQHAMDITFETKQLRDMCESERLLRNRFGDAEGSLIVGRLADMRACNSLGDFQSLMLTTFAPSNSGKRMLIKFGASTIEVEPSLRHLPLDVDGNVDWKNVQRIKLVSVGNLNA